MIRNWVIGRFFNIYFPNLLKFEIRNNHWQNSIYLYILIEEIIILLYSCSVPRIQLNDIEEILKLLFSFILLKLLYALLLHLFLYIRFFTVKIYWVLFLELMILYNLRRFLCFSQLQLSLGRSHILVCSLAEFRGIHYIGEFEL